MRARALAIALLLIVPGTVAAQEGPATDTDP
jgi:hypothetical protein